MRVNLLGIRISFDFLSLFLVCFGIVTSIQGQRIILFSLISAVLHEVGHILFISILYNKPYTIDVKLYEVKINCSISGCSFRDDILITLAGILFNFSLTFILYFLHCLIGINWIMELGLCNFCIGVINLLPIENFDGGQLLSILLSRFLPENTVNRIMLIITIIFIFPFSLISVYFLFVSQYNYSLLFITIYILMMVLSKY